MKTSRGSNRNKTKKSGKGSGSSYSSASSRRSNFLLTMSVLGAIVVGILVVSIRSCSKLHGALTILNSSESTYIPGIHNIHTMSAWRPPPPVMNSKSSTPTSATSTPTSTFSSSTATRTTTSSSGSGSSSATSKITTLERPTNSPSNVHTMPIEIQAGEKIFIPLSSINGLKRVEIRQPDGETLSLALTEPVEAINLYSNMVQQNNQHYSQSHDITIRNDNNNSNINNNNHYHSGGILQSDFKYYNFDTFSQSFHLHEQYTTYPARPVPSASLSFQSSLALSGKYQPTLCSDGYTHGFSDLGTLRNAIHELNDAYTNAVNRWKSYQAAKKEYEWIVQLVRENEQEEKKNNGAATETIGSMDIDPPPPLPQYLKEFLKVTPDPFIICPHTQLRTPIHARHAPIVINAEDIVVECTSCIFTMPGTHFSFGQYAKNVFIRGIAFMGATDTSVVIRNDGAEATFENCSWMENDGVGRHGSVLDLNSTSTVVFSNCEISDVQKVAPRVNNGQATKSVHSFTLRSKDAPL